MKLITLIAQLLMSVTREVAEISSTVFVRYVILAGGGLASALIMTGKSYDQESQRLRQRKQKGEEVDFKARGPPHIQIAAAAA
eukprot:1125566-Pyramimonas_sp.AAC.1